MFLSDLQNRFQGPSVLSFLSHQHSVFSFKADSVDVRGWEELAKLASQIKACAMACTNKQGNDMGRLALSELRVPQLTMSISQTSVAQPLLLFS